MLDKVLDMPLNNEGSCFVVLYKISAQSSCFKSFPLPFFILIVKGTMELQPQIIFVFATKIGENTTTILNCNFSKYISFWHIKLSTYRKTSLLLINSIHLIYLLRKSKEESYRPTIRQFFTLSEKKRLLNLQK